MVGDTAKTCVCKKKNFPEVSISDSLLYTPLDFDCIDWLKEEDKNE